MEKYEKLVELLNKKIIQLSRKLEVQGELTQREEEKTASTFKKS